MSTAELKVDRRPWTPQLVEPSQLSAGLRTVRTLVRVWSLLLLLVDTGVIVGAFLLAHWARFTLPDASALALGIDLYLRIGVMVGVISTALLASHGLYNAERRPTWPIHVRSVISSISTALVLAVATSYFAGDQSYSRLWFATGWLFAIVGVLLWRTVADRVYGSLLGALAPSRRVLIVGANAHGEQLARELAVVHQVIGFADNGTDLERANELPLLGSISEIERIVQAFGVDELIIALPQHRREQISRVLARGFHRRVTVKFTPEMDELLPRRFDVHLAAGRRYIGFSSAAHVSWLKRALDLLIVGLGLVCLLPLFGIVALAIKLDSTGPIFYRQERVGLNGRHFMMFKFRSMCQDADRRLEELRHRNEAVGPLFKIRQDPRITRVGGFLRRWSIDELPQLINVLRGEMSLVGPRPPIPAEVAKYEDWQLGRLRAVPGLTGLWQVSGRSDLSWEESVRLDLRYVENWSFALDLQILWKTVSALLKGAGAY